jgi:hypothetical protein
MSNYLDNNELFMKPKTQQYGNHMIMSNVVKPTKKKLINIDTQFRDEYNYNDTSSFSTTAYTYNTTLPEKYKYNITLPEKLTNVKSMKIKSIEIPMTFYNISSNFNNNYFTVLDNDTKTTTTVKVDDGDYTFTNLVSKINTNIKSLLNSNCSCSINSSSFVSISLNSSSDTKKYTVYFDTDDKYGFKSSLGWLLGFRTPYYSLSYGNSITSEYVTNSTSYLPKYLYLSIDEYSKGIQNTFMTPIYNAFLTKNVISRITINNNLYSYGSVLVANNYNGLLSTDERIYDGKVDLQKLNIQLLNDVGAPVDLNGKDFSFLIEITHE